MSNLSPSAPTSSAEGSEDDGNDQEQSRPSRGVVYLDRIVVGILWVSLVGELGILFSSVVAREVFSSALLWSHEVAQVALALIAFVGGAYGYRTGKHISFTLLLERMSSLWHRRFEVFGRVIALVTAVELGILGIPVTLQSMEVHTPMLGMPESYYLAPLPLGMLFMSIYIIVDLRRDLSRYKTILVSLGAIAVAVGLAWLFQGASSTPMITIALIVSVALLLVGIPIGFLFAIMASIYIGFVGTAPLAQIGTSISNGITSFLLLPIPFFVFAGYLMTEGGLSGQIIRFTKALVGRLPGGLWQVAIGSTFIFSGLTGAKVADVAAIGTTMAPEMSREGYDEAETASVLAASAAMGETVPPSTAMVVLGSVTSVSIGSLFLGGVLPAVITALMLAVAVAWRARRQGPKKTSTNGRYLPEVLGSGIRAIPALVVPVILIGGIVSGIATPTEVSSVAVVYALVVLAINLRRRFFVVLKQVVADTVAMSGMILFIIATATALSWVVTIAGVPQLVLDIIHALGGGAVAFWIISMAVLIIMGAVLEGLPAIILFGPLFLPVASQLGIDPVHYGVLLVAAMGVGCFMPPIGIGAHVACAVCKVRMESMFRPYLAYGSILTVKIVLIAFVPFLTLWLPNAFGL